MKAGGLGIRNTCHEAGSLNKTSKAALGMLVTALVEGTDLSLVEHKKTVRVALAEARTVKKDEEKVVVTEQKSWASAKEKKRLDWILGCGLWLTRLLSRFEGNQVTGEEWHNNLSLQYGLWPTNLPQQCNECGINFSVEHTLNCKKGGLITWRHTNVHGKWADLCKRALPDSSVGTKPYILYGLGMRAE